jgi:5-methylcytosine-specific restriction endonuclease McrA
MAGYDAKHRAIRNRLLPAAYNTPCPGCGVTMVKGMDLHLDHEEPLAVNPASRGSRIICAHCNTSAGGKLGRDRQQLRPSRAW